MMHDLAGHASKLLKQQKVSWGFLRRNLDSLNMVEVRAFHFDQFTVNIQFNPTRLASVAAVVDEEAIRKRACFLCDENRPVEQSALDCGNGFKLLCNPFPILPEHFTIVHSEHRPQRISDCIEQMLAMARAIGGRYTIFYNGPQCGASAPDHLHLQAGTHAFMPIDRDYDRVKRLIRADDHVQTYVAENYLRRFIAFESSDAIMLRAAFDAFSDQFHRCEPSAAEPLMNAICSYNTECWRLIIFPRHKHRPSFFFAKDHARMLLSPGSVDMGGVVVVPVEQDFRRITMEHLVQMYDEVTVSEKLFLRTLPR